MSEKSYIKTGRLIDGSGGAVQKNRVLVVEKGIIARVIPDEDIPGKTSAEIIDLSHCSVMPPLMDCSINLCRSSSVAERYGGSQKAAERKRTPADIARHIHFCHSHGVLGVADFAGADQVQAPVKQLRSFVDLVAVRTAGRIRTVAADDETGIAGDGLDYLKISYSPGIASPEFSEKSLKVKGFQQLSRLVGSARDAGLKTVIVANGEQHVAEAIAVGCDAVEQGFLMNMKNLEEMARRQLLWIPTLIVAKTSQELATGEREKHYRKLLDGQLSQLGQARTMGIPVAAGTTAGSDGIIHGEAVVEEIKLFIKAGYPLVEALRAASIVGTRFFDIAEINLLKPGNPANFIVSRGMVQQLPRKLSYLENIFCGGSPSGNYRKNPVKTVHKVELR